MNLEEIYNKDKKKIIIPALTIALLLFFAIGYVILRPYFEEQNLRKQWESDIQKSSTVEKLDQAEERLKESKEKKDEFASHNDVALLRYSLNDYEGAIKHWEEALKLFPDNSLVYYNMGNAYGFLNNYNKAEEMYQSSRQNSNMFDKGVVDAFVRLYKKTGQEEKIEKIYKEELIKYPANTVIIKSLAIYYEEKGFIEKAREYYNKWLEIDPDNEIAKKALEEL